MYVSLIVVSKQLVYDDPSCGVILSPHWHQQLPLPSSSTLLLTFAIEAVGHSVMVRYTHSLRDDTRPKLFSPLVLMLFGTQTHEGEVVELYLPAAQATQMDSLVAPVSVVYFPGSHAVQYFAPVTAEKEPAAQSKQAAAPDIDHVPAPQSVHSVANYMEVKIQK
jgi:hypothetical protein